MKPAQLSAAYKGVNALLIRKGARDFRSGQSFNHTMFFGENVDIHHIFPRRWCEERGIKPEIYDSIINKTPLSYRTNRLIGGDAPSRYMERLERGNSDAPPISRENLDTFLRSHLIEPELLRADRFEAFMADRQAKLLAMIEGATGQRVHRGEERDEGVEADEETVEAEFTMAAA